MNHRIAMTPTAKEYLRWAVICGSGAFGLLSIVQFALHVFERPVTEWYSLLAFAMPVVLLLAAPFFWVAYFCWRRRYHAIASAVSIVTAMVAFVLVGGLPGHLGLTHWLFSSKFSTEFWAMPFVLVCGFGLVAAPFYAAKWILLYGFRFADRHFAEMPGRFDKPLRRKAKDSL